MRRPRYIKFTCTVGHEDERLVETTDDGWPISQETEWCTHTIEFDGNVEQCDEGMNPENPDYAIGATYYQSVNKTNSDFNERQRERLEKRSLDHWNSKGRHEAADRQRTMDKKLR